LFNANSAPFGSFLGVLLRRLKYEATRAVGYGPAPPSLPSARRHARLSFPSADNLSALTPLRQRAIRTISRTRLVEPNAATRFLPWSGYRNLPRFFINPNLKLFVTYSDKVSWKEMRVLRAGESHQPYVVRFLSFTVKNVGSASAENCKVMLTPIPPLSWKGVLKQLFLESEPARPFILGWGAEIVPTEVGDAHVPLEIPSRLRRVAERIEPKIGLDQIVVGYFLGMLFSGPGSSLQFTAYLSTVMPVEICSKDMDVMIVIAGSNCQAWGRFHISIHSWDDFGISKVTKFTWIKRGLRAAYRFLKREHITRERPLFRPAS
jgi:hypothetical protein